ncbi:hypothetical protein BJ912DRAFT_1111508 [Pholiota molesta]|nr:hypothetical protein BJ912DRAFT_1111508 [Pholiota molesta]
MQTSRDGVNTHRDLAAPECIELPRRQRVALVLGMVLSACHIVHGVESMAADGRLLSVCSASCAAMASGGVGRDRRRRVGTLNIVLAIGEGCQNRAKGIHCDVPGGSPVSRVFLVVSFPKVHSVVQRGCSSNTSPDADGVMLPISEEQHSAAPPAQPPKKKVATSKPKTKRITSHLHPLDLLHLSRASRHFARMFLCTDNRHAWLAARRTVEGLPDCPSDLSEAQYAHVLFESICSGCGKIGRHLLFSLRVRFCAPCYKANVETYMMIDGVEDYRDAILPFMPHNYSVTDSSVVEYFEDQLQAIMDQFYALEAIGSGDDFLSECHDTVLALTEHGNLVSNFLQDLRERKDYEKMQLRVTRRSQIDARIMALGYTRDEIPDDAPAYEAEAMKPKAPTERGVRQRPRAVGRAALGLRDGAAPERKGAAAPCGARVRCRQGARRGGGEHAAYVDLSVYGVTRHLFDGGVAWHSRSHIYPKRTGPAMRRSVLALRYDCVARSKLKMNIIVVVRHGDVAFAWGSLQSLKKLLFPR